MAITLATIPNITPKRKNRCTRAAGHAVYRARYYNPYICRFINADPSGFAGGLNYYAFADGNPISLTDPFGLDAQGQNASPSWIQGGYNLLYTGQWSLSLGVYDAAVDAAGDYVYDNGGVRGFYAGVGFNDKFPGTGSLAGQVGVTGTWTVDAGAGMQIDAGAGLQQGGHNSLGIFTSQTVGVGGSYQFLNENTGFQAPSSDNLQLWPPAIYGGTANIQGGANFVIQNQNNAALGINSGAAYVGIIINPANVWQNFFDSFNVITGNPIASH